MRLRDRVAIVTGAAKGMGADITLRFAREGAAVVLAAREVARLEEHAGRIAQSVPGSRTLVAPADVVDEASVKAMVGRALDAFGRIDILVATAGLTGPVETPLQDIKIEDWDYLLAVKLKGTFLCCKYVVPHMIARRYGKIIIFSGTAGLRGYRFRAAYSSSQWALRGLAKTLALEVGPHNITVNAICPGVVEGGRMTKIIEEKAQVRGWTPEQVHEEYVREMALGRFTRPEDIADACVFLASEESRSMTGQDLVVDGGWYV